MVERDDRPPVATFFAEGTFTEGMSVALSESATHHARVKRLERGDVVRLTNGAGRVAIGAIATLGKARCDVEVTTIATVAPPPPIHLRVPIGDRDRMLWLAEKAAELGVASWHAVRFRRSMSVSPRGEGGTFAEKARARMIAALEQSGGAWLPTISADAAVDAIDAAGASTRLLLDAAGDPLLGVRPAGGFDSIAIVLGPEGGVEPDERESLIARGWMPAKLAETTLRFETAGVAAIAVARAAQLLRES